MPQSQSKLKVKTSQIISLPKIQRVISKGFGKRLRSAFGEASNAEIARKLNVSEPAIGNYMGDNTPKLEILIKISSLTNTSVDWLLFGEAEKSETQKSERDSYASAVVAETGLLSEFASEEIRSLRELAATSGKSVEEIIHQLVVESLRIRGLGKIPPELRFYNKTDEIAAVPVWGEIRNGGELYYFGDKQLLEIVPSIEKRKTGKEIQSPAQIARIPRAVIMDIKKDFEDIFLNPNMFHAFKINTNDFGDDGLLSGDVIICGYIFRMWNFTKERNGAAVLVEQDDGKKMILRRMYLDAVNRSYFSFQRIRPLLQSERIQHSGLSQIHYIYGVVKS